uniref:Uncharacterized protein n=1 Tax=Arundo donax TaxID=35708 RepID=A0A0A8ZMK1_ARUDO
MKIKMMIMARTTLSMMKMKNKCKSNLKYHIQEYIKVFKEITPLTTYSVIYKEESLLVLELQIFVNITRLSPLWNL